MRESPLMVARGTACGELVARMSAERATAALITDHVHRALGIITEQDVTRSIAYRVPPETPVEDVMSSPVMTVRAGEYLYKAIGRMRRARLRHMPVTGDRGRIVGTVDLNTALSIASSNLLDQIDRLTQEGTLEGLRKVKSAQVEIAREMLHDHVPVNEVQELLTGINNDLYRRVVEISVNRLGEEGWGDPPLRFCLIVMGSGGRGENYIYPDQDNGLILEDYPDAQHNRHQQYFMELSTRITVALDSIGLPLCKGGVMATNPLWRKTLSQWYAQTEIWARRHTVVAVRLSDIFYDFRGIYGDTGLAEELRGHVTDMVRDNNLYLQQMYQDKEAHRAGLNLFGRFITEKDIEAHKGALNLKLTGTMPMVESLRMLCLREGIAETSTLRRLEALRDVGQVDADTCDSLRGAFLHVSKLLLRQQIRDFQSGERVSNYVHPETLSTRERHMLLDAFRVIEDLRERVRTEFTGQLF